MGLFLLGRDGHSVQDLDDPADKHTNYFSILNKEHCRHLSLPVRPCETLPSCLPDVSPGTLLASPRYSQRFFSGPGGSACPHPLWGCGSGSAPHFGQRQHRAPPLPQSLQSPCGEQPLLWLIPFSSQAAHPHLQLLTNQEAVQGEGSSSYYLLQR